ncbi:MAG: UDP-N-acetylmuramate--L-alanine ligase [Deltaproteobacteria bacterium]|nr:UDP-N-acetylmuramate--L-alanine ligase [Deltaproteobacteria bacterium]
MNNPSAKKPSYHFIGVGGIGMSGLAELLVRQGHRVSGSDLAANAITARLETLGVTVYQGHRAEQIGEAEVVVHSTAVRETNPELAAARAQGREVLRRGEMLARLMAGHRQIAVTGAHGKTSTTAMAAAILRAGGLDPTVLVGAVMANLESNAALGRGEYFVAEADESDASFACLTPEITVITNLDREHLDFYRDLDHIKEIFAAYLAKLPAHSLVVAWRDDPHLAQLLKSFPHRLLTYSLKPGADFGAADIRLQGLGCRYRLQHQGKELGEIRLPLAGRHYVLNSLAACAAAFSLGVPFPAWQQGLADLGQIHRRCQVKGQVRHIMVMDDYGHHPAEIEATLAALAQAFPERRLIVAFQPHRYTRTQALLPEFFPVFHQAHLVCITEIYSAGEDAVPGLSGRDVLEGVRQAGHQAAHFTPDRESLLKTLLDIVEPGDLVLTLGAGDIWRLGEDLLAHLSGQANPPLTHALPGAPSCRGARP